MFLIIKNNSKLYNYKQLFQQFKINTTIIFLSKKKYNINKTKPLTQIYLYQKKTSTFTHNHQFNNL